MQNAEFRMHNSEFHLQRTTYFLTELYIKKVKDDYCAVQQS